MRWMTSGDPGFNTELLLVNAGRSRASQAGRPCTVSRGRRRTPCPPRRRAIPECLVIVNDQASGITVTFNNPAQYNVRATVRDVIGKYKARLTTTIRQRVGSIIKHYNDIVPHAPRLGNSHHAEPHLILDMLAGIQALVQNKKLNTLEAVNLYIYSEAEFCDGCLLEMVQLKLALLALGLDARIIGKDGGEPFPRYFSQARPEDQASAQATFLAHVNAFTGVDGTPAGAGNTYIGYITDVFNYLRKGETQKVIALLAQEWIIGYVAQSEVA